MFLELDNLVSPQTVYFNKYKAVFYIKVSVFVRYLLPILVDCYCASPQENITYGKACCIINCVGGFKVPYGYSTHAFYFGSVLSDFSGCWYFSITVVSLHHSTT